MRENNISKIVEECLCTACGTCKSICPKNAITLEENTAGFIRAVVNESKCIGCGLCRKSCPSDKEYAILPEDPFHGNCIKAYLAYSKDSDIRQSSQSGGLVTALLCYLLDKKLIDGAVVNRYNPKNKRTEAIYTESRDVIIQSSGSKYTQSSVVPVIFDNKNKRMAAVTLGCQAESIYQLRSRNKDCLEGLQYIIGLICAGQNSGHMTDNLIAQLNLPKAEEEEAIFAFRSKDKDVGGWPGKISVKTPKARYVLPKEKRLELKYVYEAYRCLLCYDQMCVFSDIVCGDPWGIKHDDLKSGYTVVISRTNKGQELLKEAYSAGYISLEEIPLSSVFKGQTVDNRQIAKVKCTRKICEEKGWLYPYSECSHFSWTNQDVMDEKLVDRLLYTRAYYGSNEEQEKRLSIERHRKTVKERKRQRRVNLIKKIIRKIKKLF